MVATSVWQRRINRRRTLLVGGGAAAFLVACGGSKEQTQSDIPERVEQSSQAAQDDESAQAVAGGTIRLRNAQDYPTLDPFKSASFQAQTHGGFIYSRLSRFKTGAGVDPREFEVVEDAATSFETADGLTYVYKLRPNMAYHNVAPVNGRALDSGDVKFSYERFISESPQQNALKNLIESMETPDPLTVVFKLKLRYAPFPTQIASATEGLWLFPKEAAAYDPAKVQIGTGPWVFEKETPSVGTVYNRNPNWWWKGRPFADSFQWIIIPEAAQDLAQFIAKRTDTYAPTNINQEILDIRRQVPDVNIAPVDIGTGFNMIYFSGQEPDSPFRDVRVRRAVSMALDRDTLLESQSNAAELAKAGITVQSAWSNAIVSPGWKKWWIDPKDPSFTEGQYYKFDLKEAKALLAAAGYPNGFKTEFHFTPTRYGQNFDTWSEALIEIFRQLGLDVDVQVDDYNRVYFPEVFSKGNFKGMAWGPQSGFQEVDGIIFNMVHPNGTRNHSKVNVPGGTLFQDNGRLTALVDAQRIEVDQEKRKGIIDEIQRYCSDQMIYVPAQASANFSRFSLSWPWLRNARAHRSLTYGVATEGYAHWWLDEEKRKQLGG
jgi:peptide/nickel transport system substrate-binding protein